MEVNWLWLAQPWFYDFRHKLIAKFLQKSLEVKKKALPLHSHLRKGCLRGHEFLRRLSREGLWTADWVSKKIEKNQKKVCKFRKKPYLCNPDSGRGLRPENDPRLDPRTQVKTKVFWIILRWMQGGRSEERGSYLVVMTDRRTSTTQQALKRSKKRSLKRLRFSTRSKYRETKKSRSVNSFGIKSCQGELRII